MSVPYVVQPFVVDPLTINPVVIDPQAVGQMILGEDEIPPPIEADPPAAQAQVEIVSRLVVALGFFNAGSPDPAIEIVNLTAEQFTQLQEPGAKHLATDGTVTITPPGPPPLVYDRTIGVRAQVRTTDATPLTVFTFPCDVKHLYQANLKVSGIDAAPAMVSKVMEGRFTWKRPGAAAVVVGLTVVSDVHDAAAASWLPNYAASGTNVLFTVQGAAGRTIDWLLVGQVDVFAPGGLSA